MWEGKSICHVLEEVEEVLSSRSQLKLSSKKKKKSQLHSFYQNGLVFLSFSRSIHTKTPNFTESRKLQSQSTNISSRIHTSFFFHLLHSLFPLACSLGTLYFLCLIYQYLFYQYLKVSRLGLFNVSCLDHGFFCSNPHFS